MESKPIALVLGSGGARGLAHIGVIRCLEDRGYSIRYIAGSSIGALVGGVYATGKLDIYAEWLSALTRLNLLRLLDWSFSHGSMFKGERIISELKKLIGDVDIEDLEIGYTAVATDLNAQREVWFSGGSLWDAIRASIAVPLVFAPVERDGILLVDGGLVNPLPIAPTFNSNLATTFAVDLNGPALLQPALDPDAALRRTAGADDVDARPLLAAFRERVTRFVDELTLERPRGDPGTPTAIDLTLRSMDLMQTSISRMKLAAYSPRLVIQIPRNLATFFEFHRADELIEFGYRRAEHYLDQDAG
jgi:NTE family protein